MYNNYINNQPMKHILPKGFTLVELLVVIAIVGILVVMGMVNLQGLKASARDAVRNSDLAQLRLGLALYYDTSGSYPIPFTSSGAGPDNSTMVDGTIFSQSGNALYPGYLTRTFSDPLNNVEAGYYYFYDSNENLDHRAYILCFHKEGSTQKWFYFYSTGVSGEGDNCPTLP